MYFPTPSKYNPKSYTFLHRAIMTINNYKVKEKKNEKYKITNITHKIKIFCTLNPKYAIVL